MGVQIPPAPLYTEYTSSVVSLQSDRDFRRSMRTYLRKKVKSGIIKDVKFRNSKNDSLLQLADMISGAVNRSYTEKPDAKTFREVIKSREEDVWSFGR